MTDTDMQTPLLIPQGTPLVPGKMFLRLYHGRTDPGQEMDDWGFVGPTFGPLSCYVHTYCCTFRIHGECGATEVWRIEHRMCRIVLHETLGNHYRDLLRPGFPRRCEIAARVGELGGERHLEHAQRKRPSA